MATKKTGTVNATIPKGFKKLEGARCAGFFILEEGNSVQGILKGSFITDSEFGPQKTFRIKITDGQTEALAAGGEVVKLTKGAICGLNQKGWLRPLDDVKDGTEVFVKCNGQDESLQKEGQSAPWTFDIGVAE